MANRTIISESTYEAYLAALLDGDRARCSSIVLDARSAGAELQDLYLNLFQRSLYQVGELWETHRISVALEHRATAITERLMTLVQPELFAGPARSRTVLVACVAQEFHRLGGRMVADLAELHGWRGHFLGPAVPVEALLQMIDLRKPDLLALSLSVCFNLPVLLRSLDAVASTFPGVPVLVGGQAFRPRWGTQDALKGYRDVRPVLTPEELERELADEKAK